VRRKYACWRRNTPFFSFGRITQTRIRRILSRINYLFHVRNNVPNIFHRNVQLVGWKSIGTHERIFSIRLSDIRNTLKYSQLTNRRRGKRGHACSACPTPVSRERLHTFYEVHRTTRSLAGIDTHSIREGDEERRRGGARRIRPREPSYYRCTPLPTEYGSQSIW